MDIDLKLIQAQELSQKGNSQEAGELYLEILKAAPDNANAFYRFGLFLAGLNQPDKAWRNYIRSLEIDPSQPEVWIDLANLLLKVGDFNGGSEAINNAYNLNPRSAHTNYWLGALNLINGDLSEAMKNFEKTIELDPYYLAAYKEILSHHPEPPNGQKVRKLKKLLNNKNLEPENQALIHNILAETYEYADEEDKFFFHLKKANTLQRGQLGDWRETYEKNINALMTPEMKTSFESKPIRAETLFTPIFIVSLPRSGSTLIEQILSTHPEVSGGGELPFFPNLVEDLLFAKTGSSNLGGFKDLSEDSLRQLSTVYQKKVWAVASQKPFITDKMLWNYRFIGQIRRVLPQAKVINISRDPIDCGFSIYKYFFSSPMPYNCNLEDYAWYRRKYEDLMSYWRQTFPAFIFDIEYEKLVANPEQEVRTLLEFCGLSWNPVVLDFHKNKNRVTTLSRLQVKKPINQKGVGSAQKYKDQLAPMISALENYGLIQE